MKHFLLCVLFFSCVSFADSFVPYTEKISDTDVQFNMVPIQGGSFSMGSPEGSKFSQPDETPLHKVIVTPFWMGTHEVTWDEYDLFAYSDIGGWEELDAVTRPTPPYSDPTKGLGHYGYPAINITHHGAMQYCKWLSEVTGKTYRLATEAEWEYAARAGTTTPFFFGEDTSKLDDYAWNSNNSDSTLHKVGLKLASPWGLFDIYGNVNEWVMDSYKADFYSTTPTENPVAEPTTVPYIDHSYVVRGGSWKDPQSDVRSSRRFPSHEDWSMGDPQVPKSIWWHTDAEFVGFRIVRPLSK